MPTLECCPTCKGRRLLSTREERDHSVDGVDYIGFVRIIACKSCHAVFREPEEEAAFVRAVERFAGGQARAGDRQVARRAGVPEGRSSRGVPKRRRGSDARSEVPSPKPDAKLRVRVPAHRPARSR